MVLAGLRTGRKASCWARAAQAPDRGEDPAVKGFRPPPIATGAATAPSHCPRRRRRSQQPMRAFPSWFLQDHLRPLRQGPHAERGAHVGAPARHGTARAHRPDAPRRLRRQGRAGGAAHRHRRCVAAGRCGGSCCWANHRAGAKTMGPLCSDTSHPALEQRQSSSRCSDRPCRWQLQFGLGRLPRVPSFQGPPSAC